MQPDQPGQLPDRQERSRHVRLSRRSRLVAKAEPLPRTAKAHLEPDEVSGQPHRVDLHARHRRAPLIRTVISGARAAVLLTRRARGGVPQSGLAPGSGPEVPAPTAMIPSYFFTV